jgi:GNAT superfamily N-acetyltransferase
MTTIEKADSSKRIKGFIDFPHGLYEGDSSYVPELFLAQKDLLDPKKHPFFEHSKLQLFLAYKNNKIVGRIAAIRNNNHIKFTGNKEGFFGFFDSINEYEVAAKLFDAAIDWIKNEGLNGIVGPTNFSTNEPFGMLINGFDTPPMLSMTHNKEYYLKFMDQYGFQKKVDLYAYKIREGVVSEKSVKISQALEARLKTKGVVVRPIEMKNYQKESENASSVYNAAWDKNMAFVPMTKNEFMHLCKEMKMIVDPNFCLVAEHDGKMVGFAFAIPNINQILLKIKRGRLLPFGIFKLLFGRKKINTIRIVVLGVIEGYRKMGIEAIFYSRIITECKVKNIKFAEASLILENNEMMNQGLLNLNAEVYKTYRLYNKQLSQ